VEEILLFNNFVSDFQYVPCEDIARQSCAMVRRWRIFGEFLWPPCVADADIVFLPCGFYLSIFLFFLA